MPQTCEGEDDSARKAPRVLARALALLARKSHSRAMLRRLLAQEGFCEGEIDEACQAVQAYGYLSDQRLAESIGHAAQARGKGPAWLRHTLRERQVDRQAAHETLASAECRERQDAEATLARRASRLPPPSDAKAEGRAMRFLLGRGYCMQAARAAVSAWRRRPVEACDESIPT